MKDNREILNFKIEEAVVVDARGALSEPKVLSSTQVIPARYALGQNYPNPFNPITTISFNLPEKAHVGLSIYNTSGQLVRTLVDREFEAGSYSVVWDGRDYAGKSMGTGVYLYRLEASSFSQTKKMVLVK